MMRFAFVFSALLVGGCSGSGPESGLDGSGVAPGTSSTGENTGGPIDTRGTTEESSEETGTTEVGTEASVSVTDSDTGDDGSGTTSTGSAGDSTGPGTCDTPSFDCAACDAIVPDDYDSIQVAVDSVDAPGQVCVRGGTYVQDVVVSPHVDVRGVGDETRIEGAVFLHGLVDPDPAPTTISDMRVVNDDNPVNGCRAEIGCSLQAAQMAAIEIGEDSLAVSFERVTLERTDSNLGGFCMQAMWLGDVSVSFVDSVCIGSSGIYMRQFAGAETAVFHELRVEGGRFEPMPGRPHIYQPIAFHNVSGAHPDSSAGLDVRNTEFIRAGIGAPVYFVWPNEDNANVTCSVVHNTMTNNGTQSPSCLVDIRDGSESGAPVVANNLAHGFAALDDCPEQTPMTSAGNLLAPATDFLDVAQDDVRLASGATAIDAADPLHAVASDMDGTDRPVDGDGDGVEIVDVGAHEFTPSR